MNLAVRVAALSVAVLLLAAALPAAAATPTGIVGVNTIDLLWLQLGQSARGPPQVAASMHDACLARNLTLTRFAATPYWPSDLKSTYLANKTQYWANMQTVVRTAAAMHCQLIPSLFFNWFAFADAMGEPLGWAMRNASSHTRGLWAQYIHEMVTLFHDDPTIVGWELGNELNLIADLNLTQQQPSIAPQMGTPAFRTQQDNFSTSDMVAFTAWMGSVIRQADATLQRPIGSGCSTPRPSAYHLARSYHAAQRDWTLDTQAEFEENLALIHTGLDTVTVHYYPGDGQRFGHLNPNGTAPLEVAAAKANALGKFFYVGEFGNANPGPRVFTHNVVEALQRLVTASLTRVFATVWVWEFYQVAPTVAAPFSLVPGRDDAVIGVFQQFNNGSLAASREEAMDGV